MLLSSSFARLIALSAPVVLALLSCASKPGLHSSSPPLKPFVQTEPVGDDPDDPAIWVNPSDAAQSLIVGTNKVKAPNGALVVFNLQGKILQTIPNLDRPNNVDIEYGLPLAGQPADIAVATERLQNQLRIFKISPTGLTDVTSPGNTKVFTSRSGEQRAPMGIALYKRPSDGAIFAIVAPKEGPREGYLAQYRLSDDGTGKVKLSFVRFFGSFSGSGEIEAVAVDDELGFVYYADEGNGIHKYHADPDHPDAGRELAWFGRTGFQADREGIAIYARPGGEGYIICTDQIPNGSRYFVYPRQGAQQDPPLLILSGGADSTDGLDATALPLGPNFPQGLLVAMNSGPKNFLLYRFPLW